jgi:GTP-binding protein Era
LVDPPVHRSGYVNILGKPNMGKSTLLNALVGERMSVITSKPQTTRHRILGMVNGDDFQIVFSDTPGFVDEPAYKMHAMMNAYINLSFDDADIILFVTDLDEPLSDQHHLFRRITNHTSPVLAVINKIDRATPEEIEKRQAELSGLLPGRKIYTVSALQQTGVAVLLRDIIELLPVGPPYYPKDQLTDRPERFFVSEIIRGQILELYRDEIPYSCEVSIESFSEGDSRNGPITRISAVIYTLDERKKTILLGKHGAAIKQLGTAARTDIETFLGKRVFLDLVVKVRDNWRDDERALKSFGYQN